MLNFPEEERGARALSGGTQQVNCRMGLEPGQPAFRHILLSLADSRMCVLGVESHRVGKSDHRKSDSLVRN